MIVVLGLGHRGRDKSDGAVNALNESIETKQKQKMWGWPDAQIHTSDAGLVGSAAFTSHRALFFIDRIIVVPMRLVPLPWVLEPDGGFTGLG